MRTTKVALRSISALALCVLTANCGTTSDPGTDRGGTGGTSVVGNGGSAGHFSAAGSAGTNVVLGGAGGVSGGQPGGGVTSGGAGGVAAGGAAGVPNAGGTNTGGGGGSGPVTHPKTRSVMYMNFDPMYFGGINAYATQFNFSYVTHIDLAFAKIDGGGNVTAPTADTIRPFMTAAHAAGVKVCISLGGADASTGDLGPLIGPGSRDAFVQKLSAYVSAAGFDCIDVDLEGPTKVNGDYEGFVKALAASMKSQGKQTSAALGVWFINSVTTAALQAFDFVNVMAYDFGNPYEAQTPLQPSSMAESKDALDTFVAHGLAKDKAVLGVPFYGFKWTGGHGKPTTVPYAQLLKTYGTAVQNDMISQGGDVIYLNSKATIQAKTKIGEQYGGVMAWEYLKDASGNDSLLAAINQAF